MIHHTLAFLCFFSMLSFIAPAMGHANQHLQQTMFVEDIDSLDKVIFDFEKMVILGHFIEIPVYIYSDDLIYTLDFSMSVNIENLRYESIVDHTGELQFAAYLNPDDLKLRFTSNNLSPYPVGDFKVVSIRFEVLSDIVYLADLDNMLAYLNGDECSTTLEGTDMMVPTQEIITHEILVNPNPAHDVIYVTTGTFGKLDIYDIQGKPMIDSQVIESHTTNLVDVHMLPKGNYTVRILTKDLKVKIQKIILL